MQARVRKQGLSTRVDTSEPALTDGEWANAREAWLDVGTIDAVARALGHASRKGDDFATRLVMEGAGGRPPLRLEARSAAALGTVALHRESELQRKAKLREHSDRVEALAVADALESRQEEVQLVRANRRATLVLARSNAKLLRIADALGSALMDRLVGPDGRPTEEARRMGAREVGAILRTIAGVVQRSADASQKAVTMERLLMGEPTAILQHNAQDPTEGMSPDEAERWIELGQRALERRRRRRQVLDVEASPDEGGTPADPEET